MLCRCLAFVLALLCGCGMPFVYVESEFCDRDGKLGLYYETAEGPGCCLQFQFDENGWWCTDEF